MKSKPLKIHWGSVGNPMHSMIEMRSVILGQAPGPLALPCLEESLHLQIPIWLWIGVLTRSYAMCQAECMKAGHRNFVFILFGLEGRTWRVERNKIHSPAKLLQQKKA